MRLKYNIIKQLHKQFYMINSNTSPSNKINYNLLKSLVFNGAKDKNLDLSDLVLGRINYELSIIESKGYEDYFILYSRIIAVCNELNILRTYGRGSAANSIVNYCLDITKVNSIDENLVFARFIHQLQFDLPDIDIDIPKGSQKKVIQLLKQKYPEYNTYYIVYVPIEDANYDAVTHNNEKFKKYDFGLVISTDNISNQIFKFQDEEYCIIRDISNDPVSRNKIDLVEQEYLNRLQLIVDEVGDNFHPYKLPLNDQKVFAYFASGDLENVFQFGTIQMEAVLSQFVPNSIRDLSIVYAMYRPGLCEYLPTVIKNKDLRSEQFEYSDNRVSKILNETYGVLVFQETFLHLTKEILDISFSDAELWRRKIMRDKSKLELKNFTKIFGTACREKTSLSENEIDFLANSISLMLPKSFVKAHALSYSIMGYWCCYYKTYFREIFDDVFRREIA